MATCLRSVLLESSHSTCLRSISHSFVSRSQLKFSSISHPQQSVIWPKSRNQRNCAFSSSTCLAKKGGKQESKRNVEVAEAKTEHFDPFDFTDLEAGIQKSLDRLKDDLSQLRPGGRFNPEVLEALRVQLSKDNKESVKLGDLAQAVPKGGRTIVVLVGEGYVRILFSNPTISPRPHWLTKIKLSSMSNLFNPPSSTPHTP